MSASIGYQKIAVHGSPYLYDTSTNALIQVPKQAYQILDEYFRIGATRLKKHFREILPAESISSAISFIIRAKRESGLFRPFPRQDYSSLLDRGELERSLSTQLRTLILNVTEQCNQRCKYCTYASKHEGKRFQNNPFMDWKIAKMSIDYFLARADGRKAPKIFFYGGEPFLAWSLVQRCIQYLRRQARPGSMEIAINSNLTLLNEERIDYLVGTDTGLIVSVDGPAEIHNRARVFRNGRGTHARVLENLDRIRQKDPDYFSRKVAINCTFDPADSIGDIFRYFSGELWSSLSVQLRLVKKTGDDSNLYCPGDIEKNKQQLEGLIDLNLKSLNQKGSFNYRLFHDILREVFAVLSQRRIGEPSLKKRPNRICIPGVDNLFVSSTGGFFPCEKFRLAEFDIGNCSNGIDAQKVRELLKAYIRLCEKLCQECWAYRLCSHCFLDALEGGRISKPKKMAACQKEKERLTRDLERFIYIWENEPKPAWAKEESLHFLVRKNQEREL